MPAQLIAITLIAKVPSQLIEQHSVASPYVVGEDFAYQVAQYAQQQRLGYFPPADYFRSNQLIDSELLEALDSICWLVKGLVREQVRSKLRSLFAKVEIESVQAVAHTMPTVRPSARNAMHDLALHFTPDQIRINIIATLKLSASNPDEVAPLDVATLKMRVQRCLANYFTSLDITDIYSLEPPNDRTTEEI